MRSSRESLQASSWFAVVQAYQECTRRYAQLLRRYHLTIPQFDVLTAIRQLGEEATPKAIAERLIVTRGNITGLLKRLQHRGLLTTRVNSRDGRSFLCELTQEGEELFAEARAAASLFIHEQLAPFDDQQLEQTKRLMDQMRRHLETLSPETIAARVASRSTNQEPAPTHEVESR